jgi:hypothetical protein
MRKRAETVAISAGAWRLGRFSRSFRLPGTISKSALTKEDVGQIGWGERSGLGAIGPGDRGGGPDRPWRQRGRAGSALATEGRAGSALATGAPGPADCPVAPRLAVAECSGPVVERRA